MDISMLLGPIREYGLEVFLGLILVWAFGGLVVLGVVSRRVEKIYFRPVRRMLDGIDDALHFQKRMPRETMEQVQSARNYLITIQTMLDEVQEFRKKEDSCISILQFVFLPWHWRNLIWGDLEAKGYIYPTGEKV